MMFSPRNDICTSCTHVFAVCMLCSYCGAVVISCEVFSETFVFIPGQTVMMEHRSGGIGKKCGVHQKVVLIRQECILVLWVSWDTSCLELWDVSSSNSSIFSVSRAWWKHADGAYPTRWGWMRPAFCMRIKIYWFHWFFTSLALNVRGLPMRISEALIVNDFNHFGWVSDLSVSLIFWDFCPEHSGKMPWGGRRCGEVGGVI